MVREGFEAALVVAIVFAYLRRIGRLDLGRTVWQGVVVAALLSVGIGVVVHITIGNLEGDARLRAFAAISFLALWVLTWMVFWMRRQSRAIKGELERRVDAAITSANVRRAIAAVALLAVLREGIEAALFLIAAATEEDGWNVLVGALLGLSHRQRAGRPRLRRRSQPAVEVVLPGHRHRAHRVCRRPGVAHRAVPADRR